MSDLIQLRGICKNFGPVRALKGVDLSLKSGEILALVGENGAGKSTLMKILSGVYAQGDFQGVIEFGGKPVSFCSPLDSENAGIALIHQELSTFPHLSVAENMVVGHWPGHLGFVDHEQMGKNAGQWLGKLGSDFSPQQLMSTLSTGQQQVVEIAKALAKNSKILILDEPTSSLTTRETQKLFALLRDLRAQGCGLIYISHRMEEIFALADRVTVLRDGQSVFTGNIKDVSEGDLIQHMVGRSLGQLFPPRPQRPRGEVLLTLKNFAARHRSSGLQVGPLSLSVGRGEIVGFGGLLGAGRSEILQALAGDQSYDTEGEITYKNSPRRWQELRRAYHDGLGLVTEDRKQMSLLPDRSLTENAGVLRLSQRMLFSFIDSQGEDQKTEQDLKILKTRFHTPQQKITDLSGGNQQKVIFTRVLQNAPEVLILDEPTRGVDVGAKYEIYQLIYKWTQDGKSILLVSSDLPELMALSDRIVVMSQGQIQAELPGPRFEEEVIMKWALQKGQR